MFCLAPITIYRKGDGPVLNAATGEVERPQVECGNCRVCRIARKSDWTGRLVAEAKTSQSVYFLTLTYKEEPRNDHGEAVFYYKDVQRMLYRLRTQLLRETPFQPKGPPDAFGNPRLEHTTVRHFAVGERGNKYGRIHWHLLLFFDGPHFLPDAWNKHNHPGELWEHWDEGWTDIARVKAHDSIRRVRYCAKYAVKGIGDEKSCRPRFSLKPALGSAYLLDRAKFVAEAGLPLFGYYTLPGLTYTKGPRTGESVKFRYRGVTARKVCEEYVDAWLIKRPHKPYPLTPFLARYHPCSMMLRRLTWPDHDKRTFVWRFPDGHVSRLTFAERPPNLGDRNLPTAGEDEAIARHNEAVLAKHQKFLDWLAEERLREIMMEFA